MLFGCSQQLKDERELQFISSDTLIIPDLYYDMSLQYKLSNQKNYLLTLSGRKFTKVDIRTAEIIASVDFYETDLVLPEDKLHSIAYDEEMETYAMFFPQRGKVVLLDQDYDIIDEINLEKPDSSFHRFNAYNDSFFYLPSQGKFVIRTDYDPFKQSTYEYFDNTRALRVYDLVGKELFKFGEYSENRKEAAVGVLSQGNFCVDIAGDTAIYLKQTVSSPHYDIFDLEGNKSFTGNLKSSLVDYKIYPSDGTLQSYSKIADSYMDIRVISPELTVSNVSLLKDQNINRFEDKNIVIIENSRTGIMYHREIPPHQKLVHADENVLTFFRTHPNFDEMCLIKVKYDLGS